MSVFKFLFTVAIAIPAYHFNVPSNSNATNTTFMLSDPLTPFDPAAYYPAIPGAENGCIGQDVICAISVPVRDIYPFTHPTYPLLPRVDIQTMSVNELADDMTDALSVLGTNPTVVNGRIIYEAYQ